MSVQTPMPIPTSQRFALLLLASLVGLLAFAAATTALLMQAGIHGGIYRRITDLQDLTSDIEPPPLYLVEAMLSTHELLEDPRSAPPWTSFRKLAGAFEEHLDRWRNRLSQPDEVKALEDLAAPGRRFLELAESDFLPAIASGDRARAVGMLTGPMQAAYREHREQVVRFMDLLQRHRQLAESEAHGVEIVGALGLAALLIALLAAARGMLLVRRDHVRELGEREARYRDLALAAFEGIAVLERGVLVDANPQLFVILARPDDAATRSRPLSDWFAPESRSEVLSRIAEDREQDFEAILPRPDGGRIEVEVRLRSYSHEGRRRRIMAIRDISQRKEALRELSRYREHLEELVASRTADFEAASLAAERLTQEAEAERERAVAALAESRRLEASLQRAKEEAETANRAKSDFLARMSHEIRTPLNAVLGYAQMLVRATALSPEHRRAVEVINRSGEHLFSLISDILEMSRIEAGRTSVELGDLDLHDLLDNLRSLFLLRARDKGVELAFTIAPDTPRYLRTDPRKVRQILVNLLSNAVKFSAGGTVRIDVVHDGGRLRIAVADHGPGIAEAELLQLFQPFSQAEAGRRRSDGSGLGLAISRGFARVLGGDLIATSAIDRGSVFTLDVPAAAIPGSGRPRAAGRRPAGLETGQVPPRVLIAEDHADNRELLHRLMVAMGFEVRSVPDGAQAVTLVREWSPHLVWMDVDMPVMDGLAATRAIRAGVGCSPRIIALTAAAFAEDRQRLIEAGCDEVAHKPYREGELLGLMEMHLGIRIRWEPEPLSAPEGPIIDDGVRAGLAALPEPERRAVREAVSVGDLQSVIALTAGWRDARLAGTVRTLAEAMDLERLAGLLAPQRNGGT